MSINRSRKALCPPFLLGPEAVSVTRGVHRNNGASLPRLGPESHHGFWSAHVLSLSLTSLIPGKPAVMWQGAHVASANSQRNGAIVEANPLARVTLSRHGSLGQHRPLVERSWAAPSPFAGPQFLSHRNWEWMLPFVGHYCLWVSCYKAVED